MILNVLACAAYGVVLCALLFAVYRYRFDEGKLLKRTSDDIVSGKERKVLLVLPTISCIVAAVVYPGAYEQPLIVSLQWQTMMAISAFVCIIDRSKGVIPNRILIVGLPLALLLLGIDCYTGEIGITNGLIGYGLGLLMGGGLFLISRILTRGGVGFGDIKLYALFGLLCGIDEIFGLLILALLASFVFSLVSLARKKKGLNDKVPLGPFSYIGVVLCVMLGA